MGSKGYSPGPYEKEALNIMGFKLTAASVILLLIGISFATQIADVPAENPYGYLTWNTQEIEKPFSLTVLDSQVGPTWIYFKLNASVDKDACAEKPKAEKVQIDDSAKSAFSKLTSLKIGGTTVISDSNKTKDAKDKPVPWTYSIPDLSKMDCGSSQIVEANLTRDQSIPIEQVQFTVKWGTNSTTIVASGAVANLGARVLVRDSNGYLYSLYTETTNASHIRLYVAKSTTDGATWNSTYNEPCNTITNDTSMKGAIAIDSADSIHIVCQGTDGVTQKVRYSQIASNGTIVYDDTLIDSVADTAAAGRPSIDVATNGSIGIAWRAKTLLLSWSESANAGSSWSAAARIDNGTWVDISNPVVVHASNSTWYVFAEYGGTGASGIGQIKKQNATTWVQTTVATDNASFFPSVIGLDASGEIDVAYQSKFDGGTNSSIRTVHYNGAAWGAAVTVGAANAAATQNNLYPSITSSTGDNDGTLYVQWAFVNSTNIYTVYKTSTDDGATWSARSIYATGTASVSQFRWQRESNPQPAALDLVLSATTYDRLGTFMLQTNNGTESGTAVQRNITGIVVYSAGHLYLGGESTCNITSLNASRLLDAGTLVVRNSSGTSQAIASNGTTWVAFLCNQGENNYSVEYQLSYYGSPTQAANATVPNPVLFTAPVNASLNATTCNYTLMYSDRVLGADTLWITNRTGGNVTIASNGTTWASFLCNGTGGNYTVNFKMPAPNYNCAGETQDNAYTSTFVLQYLKTDCYLMNPSSITYANVSMTGLSCMEPGATSCNLTTLGPVASMAAGANSTNQTQGIWGDWITTALPGWSCADVSPSLRRCNETINVSWIPDPNLSTYYDSFDFSPCPAGMICTFTDTTVLPGDATTPLTESIYNVSTGVVDACGTYPANNTAYTLSQNISTSSGNCLVFNGNNITFDGLWNTITVSGTGAYAIESNGTNQTLANANVVCSNASSTTSVGLYMPESMANSTSKFMHIQGCAYGVLTNNVSGKSGNKLIALDIQSPNIMHIQVGANYNASINFTNTNTRGGAGALGYIIGIGATGMVDGKYNWWVNCTGHCAWYDQIPSAGFGGAVIPGYATNETPIGDSYTTTTNPNTNYGTASEAPLTMDGKYMFWLFRNATLPPGRAIQTYGGEILSIYRKAQSAKTYYQYFVNASWEELAITNNNMPNSTMLFPADSAFAALSASPILLTFSTAVNVSNFAVWGGANIALNTSTVDAGSTHYAAYLRESASYHPYLQTYWGYMCGNEDEWETINTTFSKKKTLSTAITFGDYCSVTIPNGATPNIKYLINGSVATTTYYLAPYDNTNQWVTWDCDANTFYSIEANSTYFYITAANATGCSTGYSPVATYTAKDETTDTDTTVNATVYINSNISIMTQAINNTHNFTVCYLSSAGSMGGNITVVYQNTTSTIRSKTVSMTDASTLSVTLYTLALTSAAYYTFYVINEFSMPIPGATIIAYRYIGGAWVQADMGITDFAGYTAISLQPWYPYLLTVTAPGYLGLNMSFTPTTVTSITIRLSMTSNSTLIIPGYETMWNDTAYTITPGWYYLNGTTNITYALVNNGSSSEIAYYGWNVTRNYNGTTTTICSNNVTTASSGGTLVCTVNLTGFYKVDYWFHHTGYPEFRPLNRQYYLGSNNSGLGVVGQILGGPGFMSPWAYFFVAVMFSLLAAGFASRYTATGAGILGLVILAGFTVLNPMPTLVTVGSIGIQIWMATIITAVGVFAAFVIRSGSV